MGNRPRRRLGNELFVSLPRQQTAKHIRFDVLYNLKKKRADLINIISTAFCTNFCSFYNSFLYISEIRCSILCCDYLKLYLYLLLLKPLQKKKYVIRD